MFAPPLLLILLLSFAVVSATPVTTVDKPLITLPISRRVNAMSIRGLYQYDLMRAQALKARGNAGSMGAELINTPVTNQAVAYTADVKVGSPPTKCECSYGVIHFNHSFFGH